MKLAIKETLQVLVGLPLTAAGRAHTLEWFHFGEQHERQQRNGKIVVVGQYALHVQCSWRIISPSGIRVASSDRYFAAGDEPLKDYPDFAWERQGANRCDQRMSALIEQHAPEPLVVQTICADDVGSVRIAFDKDYALDVFPDNSFASEHWRFFQPANGAPHFVVTGPSSSTSPIS